MGSDINFIIRIRRTMLDNYIIDKLKCLADSLSFIPYRKKNKRYKKWNRRIEESFLTKINSAYNNNPEYYNNIDVNIIMPAYNRSYCIGNAIQSVLIQSHKKWNLYIVDDGSTDSLDSVIKQFSNDNRIKFFKNKHRGISHARNTGLNLVNSKYVFYLDTDNIWVESYLRNMIVFMEAGDLDACYSGELIQEDNYAISYLGKEFDWEECFHSNYIDLNSFGHSSELLYNCSSFDESINRLVDWDFILGVTAHNRTAYAPFIGVKYYDGFVGSRVTHTQHQGDDLDLLIRYIRSKHRENKKNKLISSIDLRPTWDRILK